MKLNEVADPKKRAILAKLAKLKINEISTINDDLTVVVDGDVTISKSYLTIPVKFKRVSGNFSCSYSKITSLEGAPQTVNGDFHCINTNITSLKGAPQFVGGHFICTGAKITSLEDAPQMVGSNFCCTDTNVTSLKGAPQIVNGNFYCANTRISSLEGAPQTVHGHFFCYDTDITSLEGAPHFVGGHFSCTGTKITSLAGIHKQLKMNGSFICPVTSNMLGLTLVKGITQIRTQDDEQVGNILTQFIGDPLGAQEALIEAGYKEQAKL